MYLGVQGGERETQTEGEGERRRGVRPWSWRGREIGMGGEEVGGGRGFQSVYNKGSRHVGLEAVAL